MKIIARNFPSPPLLPPHNASVIEGRGQEGGGPRDGAATKHNLPRIPGEKAESVIYLTCHNVES